MITAGSLAMVAAGSSRGAFGVFFNPMSGELQWSSAEMSSFFSISMIIEGVMSYVWGRLSDKFGTRSILILCGIISGAGFILTSLINSMWQMYLVYGLAIGIGQGGLVVPVSSMLVKWFASRRTLMTGVALAANGLGGLISPLIAYQLITNYQWRNSYVIQGVAVFILISIPALFLKRDRSANIRLESGNAPGEVSALKPPGVNFTLFEALRSRQFWIIVTMLGFYGYSFLSISVHLVPDAIKMGIPASVAASMLASFAAATLVSRVIGGAFADRFGNKRLIMVGLTTVLAALIWLIWAKESWSLFVFALVCGLGLGTVSSSQSPLAAKYFGLKSHGEIYGAIGGCTVIIGAAGPFITGFCVDITGNYFLPFIICAILVFLALTANLLFLRPPVKSI
jgi:MFS family permease